MLPRAWYRTSQVLRQVGGRPLPEDRELAAQVLSPPLLHLFERQRRGDQAHAVRVCRTLMRQGHREPALLQAALLHDVGKVVGLPLAYRVAVVLLRRAAPGWLPRLAAAGERTRWLHPFAVSLGHPALGARLAAEAGAAPGVVSLIAHHQDGTAPEQRLAPLLAALRAVDDRE